MIDTSIEALVQERGTRYGSFVEHARITDNIQNAMQDSPNWNKLPPEKKEALRMVAHKIGRILNGDWTYLDSWDDIQGYIKLATMEINR